MSKKMSRQEETELQERWEKRQEERKLKKRRRMIKLAVLKFMMLVILFSGICLGGRVWLDRDMDNYIKWGKDYAFKLYNKGIEKTIEYKSDYGKLEFEFTSPDELNLVYNQGIKYLKYPDLMHFKIGDEIKYNKERVFYYPTYKSLYVEVIVPKEHETDIDYYGYNLHIKNSIIISSLILGVWITIIWILVENAIKKGK